MGNRISDIHLAEDENPNLSAAANTRSENSANPGQMEEETLPGSNGEPLNANNDSSLPTASRNGAVFNVVTPQFAASAGSSAGAPINYFQNPQFGEDEIRQCINFLLHLPAGELSRHMNAVALAIENRDYNRRFATVDDLNNLSMNCSNTQIKLSDASGSMNTAMHQMNVTIRKKKARIASLKKRAEELGLKPIPMNRNRVGQANTSNLDQTNSVPRKPCIRQGTDQTSLLISFVLKDLIANFSQIEEETAKQQHFPCEQTKSNEDLVRERLNHLSQLPTGELLRHYKELPFGELNYNRNAINRVATKKELNHLSLYGCSNELKIAETMDMLTMMLGQMENEVQVNNNEIETMETCFGAEAQMLPNVQQQIDGKNNEDNQNEDVFPDVDQMNGTDQAMERISAAIEEVRNEVTANISMVNEEIRNNADFANWQQEGNAANGANHAACNSLLSEPTAIATDPNDTSENDLINEINALLLNN